MAPRRAEPHDDLAEVAPDSGTVGEQTARSRRNADAREMGDKFRRFTDDLRIESAFVSD